MRRNSRMASCASFTFGLFVWTTMPSAATVEHEIASFGIFSTSTRHIRQLPAIVRPGCQQYRGTNTPAFSAARITVVPASTSTSRPSMVSLGNVAPLVRDVMVELAPELRDERLHGPGGRV